MDKIKTQVAFSKELLHKIDQVVQPRKRSEFIEEAVQEKLRRMQAQSAFSQVAGIWRDREDMTVDGGVQRYIKGIRSSDVKRYKRLKKAWGHGKASTR